MLNFIFDFYNRLHRGDNYLFGTYVQNNYKKYNTVNILYV